MNRFYQEGPLEAGLFGFGRSYPVVLLLVLFLVIFVLFGRPEDSKRCFRYDVKPESPCPYVMILDILRFLVKSTFRNFSFIVILILATGAAGAKRTAVVQNTGNMLQDSSRSKEPASVRAPMTLEESATAQVAYMINCRACHGVDRMGASAPSLYKLNTRVTFNEFITVVDAGSSQMPGFPLLNEKTRIALYKYLSEVPVQADPKPDQKKQ